MAPRSTSCSTPSSALDVAAFVVAGVDLSPGAAIPSDGDPRIDRALAGFLFTCGPDHIRHPRLWKAAPAPIIPARLRSPERLSAGPICAGQAIAVLGGDRSRSRLRRPSGHRAALASRCGRAGRDGLPTASSTSVRRPLRPMMMYHMNIGGAAARRENADRKPVGRGRGRFPGASARGTAHFCRPAVACEGWSEVALSAMPGLQGRTLPCAVLDRDAAVPADVALSARGANVVSIEPASHRLAKRPELAANGELGLLQPRSIA